MFKSIFMSKSIWIFGFALFSALVFSCKKEVIQEDTLKNPRDFSRRTSAPQLSYGAKLFFLKPTTKNYTILPTIKPSVQGVFKAIPRGLSLDSLTGRVNINRSLSGMRYKVYYVTPTGGLVDSTQFVISGIDYADSIFVLNATPNTYDMAYPIYNANKNNVLPCDEDDDDSDDLCVFDETDLNNDGNDDIDGVIQQKLLVNEKNGVIDIEGSYHAGIFGSSNPPNGTRKNFTFYYRLRDASNMALNKITVQVYYYRRSADVPNSLKNLIKQRKAIDERVLLSPLPGNANELAKYDTYMDFNYYSKPRRPPILVIVGQ
jgi:hypothetical protein